MKIEETREIIIKLNAEEFNGLYELLAAMSKNQIRELVGEGGRVTAINAIYLGLLEHYDSH